MRSNHLLFWFSRVAAVVWSSPLVAFGSLGELDGDGEALIQLAAAEARSFQHACSRLSLTANVVGASLSRDEIDKELAVHLQAIDQAIKDSAAFPEMVKKLQDARASDASKIIEQIIANQNLTIFYELQTFGQGYGGDALVEYRVRRGADTRFSIHSFFLNRVLDEHRVQNLVFDAAARTAMVSRNKIIVGIEDPLLNGRLPVFFHDTKAFEFVLIDGVAPMGTGIPERKMVSILKRESEPRVEVARVIVAIEGGTYVCPLIEWMDRDGVVVRKSEAFEYFQSKPNGVVYPGKWQSETTVAGKMSAAVEIVADRAACLVSPKSVNRKAAVVLPAGTCVLTEATSGVPQQSFMTKCEVELGIDDLDSLATLPCIEVTEVSAPVASHSTDPLGGRRLVLVGNVLAVTILVFWAIWRRRGKRGTETLVVGFLMGIAGCGHAETSKEPSILVIEPNTLDLGEKSAGQVVPFEIRICTTEKADAVDVDVEPGCSCTDVSPLHFTLQPGFVQVVSGTISTHGRKGDLEAGIRFIGSDQRPIGEALLRAVIRDDIFTIPSRLALIVQDDGVAYGTTSLHLPDRLRDDVSCVLNIPDGTVSVLPGELSGCLTLEVRLSESVDKSARIYVSVMASGQAEPIMRIPVSLQGL